MGIASGRDDASPESQPRSSTFLPAGPGGGSRFASKNTGSAAIRASASIVVDDPMVDRRHARVYRDEKNRWIIANARSTQRALGANPGSRPRARRVLSVRRTAVFLQGALRRSVGSQSTSQGGPFGGRSIARCNCRCCCSDAAALRIMSPNMLFIWAESWLCSLSWSSRL